MRPAEAGGGEHPAGHWVTALSDALASPTETSDEDGWQLAQARRELAEAAEGATSVVGLPDVRAMLVATTQGNQDQDPAVAIGTSGPVTITAGGYGRVDNNGYTVAYNGAAGTTLATLTIDLSPIGAHFDTTTWR